MLDGNREEPWRVESSTLFSNDFFSSVAKSVCSEIILTMGVRSYLRRSQEKIMMTTMWKERWKGRGWPWRWWWLRCIGERRDGREDARVKMVPKPCTQSTIPSAQSTPQCTIAPPICNAMRTTHSEMHCPSCNAQCTLYTVLKCNGIQGKCTALRTKLYNRWNYLERNARHGIPYTIHGMVRYGQV